MYIYIYIYIYIVSVTDCPGTSGRISGERICQLLWDRSGEISSQDIMCIYIYIYAHVYVYIYIYIYIYIHIYVCV